MSLPMARFHPLLWLSNVASYVSPHLLYPLVYGRTLGLLPYLGSCNNAAVNIGVQRSFQISVSYSSDKSSSVYPLTSWWIFKVFFCSLAMNTIAMNMNILAMNNIAMSICIQAFVQTCVSHSLWWEMNSPGSDVTGGQMLTLSLTIWETARLFSKVMAPLDIPTSSVWGPLLHILVVISLSDYSYPGACEGVFHGGFDLPFPDD